MTRRKEVPRLVAVILLGVLAGLMVVLLYHQASRQGGAKPLYKTWQAYVFLGAVVGLYVFYLKQHVRAASQHVVDEKVRTHRLIACLPQAVVVTDDAQRVLAANAAALRLLGVDLAECLEAPLASLAVPEGGAEALPTGQGRVRFRKTGVGGVAVTHPVSPERGTAGGTVILLLPEERAEAASGGVDPGLGGAVARLRAKPGDEAMAEVLLAADRAADFAAYRAAPPASVEATSFPVGPLADEALAELDPVLRLRALRLERAGEWGVQAKGDRPRARAALKELLRNAVAYAEAGGTLSLALERAGGETRLKITNSGAAFGADGPGEGAGISAARQALEGSGGALRLEGAPGRGTRVTVTLPSGL